MTRIEQQLSPDSVKIVNDISLIAVVGRQKKLMHCLTTLIFDDHGMRENTMEDIVRRVENTFTNKRYLDRLKGSRKNWLGMEVADVLAGIVDHLRTLM